MLCLTRQTCPLADAWGPAPRPCLGLRAGCVRVQSGQWSGRGETYHHVGGGGPGARGEADAGGQGRGRASGWSAPRPIRAGAGAPNLAPQLLSPAPRRPASRCLDSSLAAGARGRRAPGPRRAQAPAAATSMPLTSFSLLSFFFPRLLLHLPPLFFHIREEKKDKQEAMGTKLREE